MAHYYYWDDDNYYFKVYDLHEYTRSVDDSGNMLNDTGSEESLNLFHDIINTMTPKTEDPSFEPSSMLGANPMMDESDSYYDDIFHVSEKDFYDWIPDLRKSQELQTWINIITVPIIIALGVVGIATNVINIKTFRILGTMKDMLTPILFLLAIADMFTCLLSVFSSIVGVYILPSSTNHHQLYQIYLKVIFGHVICAITVYLAFNRTASIILPDRIKDRFGPKYSCAILICVIGLTVGLQLFLNSHFEDDYYSLAWFISEGFLRPISILLVLAFNVFNLVRTSCGKNNYSENENVDKIEAEIKTKQVSKICANVNANKKICKGQRKYHAQLNRITYAISAIFLVSYFPGTFSFMAYSYAPNPDDFGYAFVPIMNSVSHVFELGKTSSSFILYCIVNSKFRKIIRNQCPCLKNQS